jgi:hypothetical protein
MSIKEIYQLETPICINKKDNIEILKYTLTKEEYVKYVENHKLKNKYSKVEYGHSVNELPLLEDKKYFFTYQGNLYKEYINCIIYKVKINNTGNIELDVLIRFNNQNSLFRLKDIIEDKVLHKEYKPIDNSNLEDIIPKNSGLDTEIDILSFNRETFNNQPRYKKELLRRINESLYNLIVSLIDKKEDYKLILTNLDYEVFILLKELLSNKSIKVIDETLKRTLKKGGIYYEYGVESWWDVSLIKVKDIINRARYYNEVIILYSDIEYKKINSKEYPYTYYTSILNNKCLIEDKEINLICNNKALNLMISLYEPTY